MSKRYWAFAGSTYYPSGGFNDFVGQYESQEEAMADMERRREPELIDWWEVVDTETATKVQNWDTTIYKHRR